MNAALRTTILASALITVCVGSLPGQVASSRSPMLDLINRGKSSLNDFRYRSADSIWQQLLTRPLTRQQRIEVLQLLAATMYPDDAAEQKKDSAATVVRRLVGMGVKRMVVRDVSWPGLDSLYASVVVSTRTDAAAPSIFDSVQDVLGLVNDGYPPGEIPERVSIDCYSFAFDELDAQLRRVSSAVALSGALKQSCTRLHVESDPVNTRLTVAQRDLGVVPDRGIIRWVLPAASAELAVSKGPVRIAKVVELPAGKLVQVRFTLPEDTAAWPALRTAEQIAGDLRAYDGYAPTTFRPAEPVRPNSRKAWKAGLLWGLLGGAAGFAVGQFLPAAKCTAKETVPAGQTWNVRGTRYTGGDEVNMGSGMPCVAATAGGAGISLFAVTAMRQGLRNRSANGLYQKEVNAHATVVKEWEERERRAFAERNPAVRQALTDQQNKLAEVQASNAKLKARSSGKLEPQITVRDLRPSDFAPATAAPAPR